jgi:hypothetical protein
MRQHLAGFRYASAPLNSREGSVRPCPIITKRYVSTSSSSSSSGNKASPVELPPVPRASATAVPTKERSKRAFAFPCLSTFSDTRLAKLSRCVSCELTWTTRKTVVEKVKHISTCAKKQNLEDATLSALIERELQKEPEESLPLKKKPRKNVEDDAEHSPKTLLSHVRTVEESKKGRRPAILASVRDPTTAAVTIRGRAKDLFGLTSGDERSKPSQPPRWTPSGARLLAAAKAVTVAAVPDEPLLTQPFGKSALAGQSKSAAPRSLFMSYDVPTTDADDDNCPPTIQAFTPSCLTGKLSRTHGKSEGLCVMTLLSSILHQTQRTLIPSRRGDSSCLHQNNILSLVVVIRQRWIAHRLVTFPSASRQPI